MTTLVGSYSVLETRLLVAAYYTSNRLDKNSVSLEEIQHQFDLEFPERHTLTALVELTESGLSNEKLFSAPLLEQRIWLSAAGLREAERVIEADRTDVLSLDRRSRTVPSAQGMVRLDHNRPEYTQIALGLDDAIRTVEATRPNDLSGDEHTSVVAGLKAARKLWDAYQLSMVQVKIGLVFAIEDAQTKLKIAFKETRGSFLVELIKSFLGLGES